MIMSIINKEIKLDPKKYIVSKTSTKGIIEYGNDYFVDISGYTESELIGHSHNIIRHPDMPKIIFKMMWERISTGYSMFAVVKNLAKDGRYYWVVTEFESKKNPLNNEIIQYTAFRRAATSQVSREISILYEKLKSIEDSKGVDAAEKYLIGYFEDMGMSYDDYIDKLVGNRGFFAIFFKAMKKLFR